MRGMNRDSFRFDSILGHVSAGCLLLILMVTAAQVITSAGLNGQDNAKAAASLPSQSVRLEPGLWLDGFRSLGQPTQTAMALSSDGRFIVFSAIKENPGTQDKSQIYMQKLDQGAARPIAGTEGGVIPFLSPDNRWIGFFANSKLMKIPIEGGAATALCDLINPIGASWGTDGKIAFVPDYRSGISRISAEGGKPEILTNPDPSRDENTHRIPRYLPGGKGILFTNMADTLDVHPRVALLDLGTGKWRDLIEEAADARYVNTGHLVFLRNGALMAVPFDPNRLEITGKAVPVYLNISQALVTGGTTTNNGAGQFDISASGSLVYVRGGIFTESQNKLVWVDQKGNAEPITIFGAPIAYPHLSPDGQKIVYRTSGRERLLWVYDVNRKTRTALTSEGNANYPIWTPDGKRIVFGWNKTGVENLFWQAADASSPLERLTTSQYYHHPSSISPDGKTLAFIESTPGAGGLGHHIMLLDLSNRQIKPLLNSKFTERTPEFSPDGRWLIYTTNESGRFEIYVQPYPGPGNRQKLTEAGGSDPIWSRNGKQIFYRYGYQVWVMDVQTSPSFSASKPRMLFENTAYGSITGGIVRGWDVTPDGQRFMMVNYESRMLQPITGMIFVPNWSDELKRLVR